MTEKIAKHQRNDLKQIFVIILNDDNDDTRTVDDDDTRSSWIDVTYNQDEWRGIVTTTTTNILLLLN